VIDEIRNSFAIRVADSTEPVAERSHSRILGALCLGYFMVILDTTVVNVALPDIQRQLGASFSSLQWVVDGYALVFASLLLTGGGLTDRCGGRRAYLLGFALFTTASVLCGIAPTMAWLLTARAVQGVGAALLVPASLSLLRTTFPETSRRASAIAIWAATAGVAAGSGPVIGGFLIDLFDWRSAFLVNLPFGLLGLFLTVKHATSEPVTTNGCFDGWGPIASVVALGGLTTAFIVSGSHGWANPAVLTALVLGIAGLVLLIVAESRAIQPMLPLALFKRRAFSAVTAIGFLLNFGFYGQLFLLALYFQQSRGLSPSTTGLALLPETGMALFANLVSGRVTARFGPRWPMATGLLCGSAGLLALIPSTGSTGYLPVAIALVAVGFGAALTVPAVTALILEVAPGHQSGISAGVLNSARQTGGVLGVAMLGAIAASGSTNLPRLDTALFVAGGAMLLGCLVASVAGRS
jgi:DHA2 family methylenomycin A resistance protein-like MFS transporter